MTDYNWGREYKHLWWDLRKLGLDPEDPKTEEVSKVIFEKGYSLGWLTVSVGEGYGL